MIHITAALLLILISITSTTLASNPRPNSGGDSNIPDKWVPDRGSYNACPQQSTLHCHNGSECAEGESRISKQHSHLNLQTHDGGYYCKCLEGYIGHECRIQVDDCDGDTGYNPSDPTGVLTSCYHGSKCRLNGPTGAKYCDCNQLNEDSGPVAKKFAGLMCQHESTSMCAASIVGSGHAKNNQFCTNHGKCVKLVTDNEPHPGCVCKDGYTGDHCEIRVDPLTGVQQNEGGNVIAGKVLFSLLIIAMGSVATGIGVLLLREKKKRDAASSSSDTSKVTKKTVIGEGDLNADGSGTLGNELPKDDSFVIEDEEEEGGDAAAADGDMELTLKEEEVIEEKDDPPEDEPDGDAEIV